MSDNKANIKFNSTYYNYSKGYESLQFCFNFEKTQKCRSK